MILQLRNGHFGTDGDRALVVLEPAFPQGFGRGAHDLTRWSRPLLRGPGMKNDFEIRKEIREFFLHGKYFPVIINDDFHLSLFKVIIPFTGTKVDAHQAAVYDGGQE
jgi:hypothetical protein